MRQKKIEAIVRRTASLRAKVDELKNFLDGLQDEAGQSFDLGKQIPERDSSVAQIIARTQAASGIIVEFENATRADMVPFQTLDQMQQAITKYDGAIDGVINAFRGFIDGNGGLRRFNYDNFHIESRNGQSSDARSQFHSLFDSSETFLQRFFSNLFILKPRGAFSFQAAASSLAQAIQSANETLLKLQADSGKAETSSQNLLAKGEEATGLLEEIKRLKSDASADRKTVADYLGEVTQHRATVQSIQEEAKTLQDDVEAYQSAFDQFKKQLDARESAYTQGTQKLDSLIAKFDEQRDEIGRIIKRSEEMLSSATISGLAANFSSMTEKLTKELWWARFAFYVGIAFLTLSALPLLAFVLLPVFGPFFEGFSPELIETVSHYGPGGAANSWQYLGQVLARISVLLPAAWFVSFAALRHSSLFRLREHYAYKYSMAVSVEGFKQQAPSYEQEIAALVLEQLAFNPADKLVSSKEAPESRAPGIAGHLLEKIRERVELNLSEEGRPRQD